VSSRNNIKYWVSFRGSLPAILKERGLKQTELAAHLNVTANTISNWVNGGSYPSTEMLFEMADDLGVSLDRLVGRVPPGTESMPRLRELVEALNAALKLVPDEATTRGKKGRPH
jgi:transcriptional regulator with XRE-family HTH domain